jgi:hypothetical protein
MKRDYIDFQRLHGQDEIHIRLINWARYVRDHPRMWPVQPMFQNAKTSRQWDLSPHVKAAIDELDGLLVEKTIRNLPERNRDALRWYYVYAGIPVAKIRRHLAVTLEGLDKAVRDGRSMVNNLLRRG